MIVGEIIAKLGLDAKQFNSGMKRSKESIKGLSSSVSSSSSSLVGFKTKIAAVAAAAIAAGKGLTSMIREVQTLHRTIDVVAGGSEEAKRVWEKLRHTSKRLGLDVEMLAGNYVNLTAASAGSALSQEQMERLFVALSQKAAVFGLSGARVHSIFKAISDMASSTVVNMQDLKLQLGQAMPGAMQTMAKAMGVTVSQMKAMVSEGKVLAEEVLPLLAMQLEKETAESVKMLGFGLRSSIANLKTAFFGLKEELADSVITDALSLLISTMTLGTKVFKGFVYQSNLVYKGFKGFVSFIKEAVKAGDLDTLGTLGIDLGNLKVTTAAVKEAVDEVTNELEEAQTKYKETLTDSKKGMEDWQDDMLGIGKDVTGEFTKFIGDLATGTDVSLTKMLNNMAKKLLEFTTTMLVIKPILDWFQGWIKDVGGGSLGGSLFGNIFQTMTGMPNVPKVKAMAGGGIISEPVLGIGMKSQSGYLLGEAGPEAVIPAGAVGSGQSVNVTINAVDSKSLAELMSNNPGAITGPLTAAIANGDRGLSTSLKMAVS